MSVFEGGGGVFVCVLARSGCAGTERGGGKGWNGGKGVGESGVHNPSLG